MAAVMAMMERMGMGSKGAMMGMDGGGGMGIAPASDHSTPEELVALVLRPHGGGMPMGGSMQMGGSQPMGGGMPMMGGGQPMHAPMGQGALMMANPYPYQSSR